MIELWLTANPSIVEMEEVLARLIARTDHDEVRNHNAVNLHAHLLRRIEETSPPADRTRLNAMMGELLTKVFAITLPPESEYS